MLTEYPLMETSEVELEIILEIVRYERDSFIFTCNYYALNYRFNIY